MQLIRWGWLTKATRTPTVVQTIAEPQTGTNPHKTAGTVEHELGEPEAPSRESE